MNEISSILQMNAFVLCRIKSVNDLEHMVKTLHNHY